MRSCGILLVCALLVAIALVPAVSAATLNCEVRTSCLSNQTLLLRLNSSETGQLPNNSHAQLANYSGAAYPYSVCCWTDSFRTLNNSCGGNGVPVLKLFNVTDSHVQAGTQTGYAHYACLNVTAGNVSCTYEDTTCSTGTSILSIASSESADANLTNAHVATPTFYKRQVCCKIGGQTPPTVAYANLTPINTTKRLDLTCGNGSVTDADGDAVTLHYNWYRNGTSMTLFNMPMDYDDTVTVNQTHDISGANNHGTVNGATFLPMGGRVGGGFSFDGNDYIEAGNRSMATNQLTLAVWIKPTAFSGSGSPIGTEAIYKLDFDGDQSGRMRFLTNNNWGGSILTSNTALSTDTWYFVVATYNGSLKQIYFNGVADANNVTTSGTITSAAQPLYVGSATYSNYYFRGVVDEAMVFNRSLTAAEVKTLYDTYNRQLNRSEMMKNDLWNCSITPIDSTGLNGSTVYSNGSYVNASIPYIVNLTYPLHNNQSVFERSVNFSWTTADEPDGDTVTYTLSVVVTPGACSVQSTLTNLQTTNRTVGELCVDQLYNWTVNACDVDGCSGNTTLFNFTIASVIGIRLAGNVTDFGVLTLSQNNATDGPGGPNPLVLENNGNVYVNVSLNASQTPFTSVGLGNAAFQYRIADNETGSFNTSGSQTLYTPVPSGATAAIRQLNFTDAADSVRIHTNITVPSAEPPGTKTTNLTFRAVVSQTP